MYCHDLEVVSSNPSRVKLGVRSTSVPSRTLTKPELYERNSYNSCLYGISSKLTVQQVLVHSLLTLSVCIFHINLFWAHGTFVSTIIMLLKRNAGMLDAISDYHCSLFSLF